MNYIKIYFIFTIFIYSTPFFSITYQEAQKKIQDIAPLIEKANEYKNNGQLIKFKKEKEKILKFIYGVFNNSKIPQLQIEKLCSVKIENINQCIIICENNDENNLEYTFIDTTSFADEFFNVKDYNDTYNNEDIETYIKDINQDINDRLTKLSNNELDSLNKFLKKNSAIDIMRNINIVELLLIVHQKTYVDLIKNIYKRYFEKIEDFKASINSKTTSIDILKNIRYTANLNISLYPIQNWLNDDYGLFGDNSDLDKLSIPIYLFIHNNTLNIQAFEIDNIIIPIQDVKTKDIKTLALQYFPKEYCQKQFNTSYIEKEKRCESKEELEISIQK